MTLTELPISPRGRRLFLSPANRLVLADAAGAGADRRRILYNVYPTFTKNLDFILYLRLTSKCKYAILYLQKDSKCKCTLKIKSPVHFPMWAGEIGFQRIKAENGKTERNIL